MRQYFEANFIYEGNKVLRHYVFNLPKLSATKWLVQNSKPELPGTKAHVPNY